MEYLLFRLVQLFFGKVVCKRILVATSCRTIVLTALCPKSDSHCHVFFDLFRTAAPARQKEKYCTLDIALREKRTCCLQLLFSLASDQLHTFPMSPRQSLVFRASFDHCQETHLPPQQPCLQRKTRLWPIDRATLLPRDDDGYWETMKGRQQRPERTSRTVVTEFLSVASWLSCFSSFLRATAQRETRKLGSFVIVVPLRV